MATYIEMPKLADTMTEGTLVKWRKQEGDKVEVGDIIAEVETDKATMEMEAFDEGVLHKFLVQAGQKIPVGGQMALVLAAGEKPPAEGEKPAAKSVQANVADCEPKSGQGKEAGESSGKSATSTASTGGAASTLR